MPRRIGYGVALLAILGGLAIVAHVLLFYQHSHRVGTALVHAEEHATKVVRGKATCVSSFPASDTGGSSTLGSALAADGTAPAAGAGLPPVYALLESSSIGLVAPVVSGVGDSQLSVAVGHVPASSWPGTSGTSVLAGHDVTWFSEIDQLQPGEQISVVTPCQTFVYTVYDHRVVSSTTAIDQTAAPRLVLVTCYPLNALFLTSQRYVLYASLDQIIDTGAPTRPAPVPLTPNVPAPAALLAQGLGLTQNPAPLGSLSIQGTPTPAFRQSSGPLNDEGAVLALYFAALRSAEQDQPGWWSAVAPGVPFSAASPLVNGTVVENDTTFDPSLTVVGATMTGASLITRPELSGNDSPGNYQIQMTATVAYGTLVLSSWTMQPVG